MTKMSTLFIFDRVTGEPLFGMEERAVPQSDLPGEATWPTQPFPLQPPPLARTTFDRDKDLYALTPEHAAYCRDLWDDNRMYTKGMFTPPGLDGTMVMFPSTLGGGNWSGVSYDAARGLLITNIMNLGQVARMERRAARAEGRAPFWRTSPWGSAYGRFWNPETKVPCSAPPFGELVAVDVNRAAVVWRVPLGVFDDLAARGFGNTGTPNIGGTITTASGLVFIGATDRLPVPSLRRRSGRLLWETVLEASAHATPMTFLGRDGRQFVVVAAGGGGLCSRRPGSGLSHSRYRQTEPRLRLLSRAPPVTLPNRALTNDRRYRIRRVAVEARHPVRHHDRNRPGRATARLDAERRSTLRGARILGNTTGCRPRGADRTLASDSHWQVPCTSTLLAPRRSAGSTNP